MLKVIIRGPEPTHRIIIENSTFLEVYTSHLNFNIFISTPPRWSFSRTPGATRALPEGGWRASIRAGPEQPVGHVSEEEEMQEKAGGAVSSRHEFTRNIIFKCTKRRRVGTERIRESIFTVLNISYANVSKSLPNGNRLTELHHKKEPRKNHRNTYGKIVFNSSFLFHLKEAHSMDVVATVASEAMVNALRKRHQIACLDVNPHPPM